MRDGDELGQVEVKLGQGFAEQEMHAYRERGGSLATTPALPASVYISTA